ncbi:MAG TPA: PRTRC system protein E [Candidatus Competibacter sp.]|nr:PRTRC system protein E [Candidatus Competibacteraceae bacterium]HRW65166.1 PRTRC system protein E [Candidatus Competibacter sp.]
MELFEWLSRCLGPGERLRLEITREGESLSVLAQPLLKTAPPNLDDERQQLRAALAHPWWLTGTPDQLDRELPEALRTYAHQRQTLQAAASEWDALDDAIRRAQQAVQTQRQKAAKQNTRVPPGGPAAAPEDTGKAAAAEEEGTANATSPAVTPPAAATNPDSLF